MYGIISFGYVGCILFIAEASEAKLVLPYFEWTVAGDEVVNTKIELLLSD